MADDNKKDAKKEGDKPEGDAAAAEAPKKSKKMLFIIIGAVVVLLLGIGIPVTMVLLKPKAPEVTEIPSDSAKGEAAKIAEGANDEEELAEGEEPLGAILPLETFVVNLAGAKYIRCQIQIEFMEKDVPKKFFSRSVPFRDQIITLLTSKTAEDLGSEKGKEELRNEVKEIANELLKKEEVKRVYFTQFVIQ